VSVCVCVKENTSSGPPSIEIVADKKQERNRDPDVKSGRAEKNSTAKTDGGNDGGQEAQNRVVRKREKDGNVRQKGERRRSKPNPRLSNPTKNLHGEQVAAGWPAWLSAVAGEAINGWIPRRADTFEKIDKASTYSNVYKAKDTMTGKIVALKKVRFDNLEPESVKFMAREILILRRLDHPNVVKLEGLVTSRMSCSLYLVFEYMEHDLAGLAASPTIKFTEPQVKCYMHQLLSGLEHCHNRHVLHRDIKGSNLLLDNDGSLKIADFGLASFFDPNHKQPMTSRVVTLWYRPPELLLGATDYGVGIDLWSAGCILAELLAGKPIMPGRTEVEQLHKIFKLCGSPSEEYWKKSKLPHATIFKPQQAYKRCIAETFKNFPPSSLPLIDTLLAINPAERQTAAAALKSEFFMTKPYACDPSSLPKYPPTKEMDAKLRDEEAAASSSYSDLFKSYLLYQDLEIQLEEILSATNNFDDENNYIGGGGFGRVYKGEVSHSKGRSMYKDLEIQLEEILSATNNFDDENNYIGGGGFGRVYKGELSHFKGRSMVAVKRLGSKLSSPTKNLLGEQVAAGWPAWLSAVAGEAINGWIPRRADTFKKIDKATSYCYKPQKSIGQGTYSNVYKAKDTITGKIVALKKVRFDNLEPESVKFMAREILVLRRLDHPNVVKLEGLVTSKMSCSLYLVFEYMEHDLAGLASSPTIQFTEPQVKCYMQQLLSGLEHCHNRHVLHRDIKGSNLLLNNNGSLKIADFGSASFFDPNHKQPMTSRVVTLWYRPPELLLGATDYGVGIDLWSAGCILAELLAGKPIMPGRTEVEQLHKIFRLCGSPSEEYWKMSKLPHATIFKPRQAYKRCIAETFKNFPPSSLPLIDTLLAIDPAERQTATTALKSEFFTTKPYACDPSSLPKYPPTKEMDAKLRDEDARW
ncbi:hypothetical protein M8C21_022954, partial [Ambrosia artemisiifolia]